MMGDFYKRMKLLRAFSLSSCEKLSRKILLKTLLIHLRLLNINKISRVFSKVLQWIKIRLQKRRSRRKQTVLEISFEKLNLILKGRKNI